MPLLALRLRLPEPRLLALLALLACFQATNAFLFSLTRHSSASFYPLLFGLTVSESRSQGGCRRGILPRRLPRGKGLKKKPTLSFLAI